jgi:hypothetical protein
MFADKIISFLTGLDYKGPLPEGISIMNPFRDNPQIIPVISQFYNKYYGDEKIRHIILGINPGRFGAGITGIPFTDTRRLAEKCGLSIPGIDTFETSSVFVYEMIDAYGGAEKFYSRYYISAVSPLGFTSSGTKGKQINYNYYDNGKLTDLLYDFIVESIRKQLEFGIARDKCFCLGTGKNYKFLLKLNNDLKIFDSIIPLEHPRYVMQYRSKQKQYYINKYLSEL